MTLPLAVLIVNDEPNIHKILAIALEVEGHRVAAVGNFLDALGTAARRFGDGALVDLCLGTASGLKLIPALLSACPWMKIAVISAYAFIDPAAEAMRRGASDYLPKPFTVGPEGGGVARRRARPRTRKDELTGKECLSPHSSGGLGGGCGILVYQACGHRSPGFSRQRFGGKELTPWTWFGLP